jgi:hypothetical protein
VRAKGKFLAAGALLALSGGLLAAGTGAAKADAVISLPGAVTYLTQTLPDTHGGHSYLFIAANGEIMVDTVAGKAVTTLDAGDGISGLALSANGAILYASVDSGAKAGSVAAITVSSIASGPLKQVFYPLAPGDQPAALAVQSGKVWVSYSTGPAAVQVGAIDLADKGAFEPAAAPGAWTSGVQLAADPNDTGVLVVVSDQSPAEAATYNTTKDPAPARAAQGNLGQGGTACVYPGEIAVAPGGQRFLAGCDGPSGAVAYSPADIAAPAATYNANGGGESQAIAVAVDPSDGSVAVANRTTIYVYKPNGTLLNILAIPAGNKIDEAFGLVWADAAGGPDLAAIFQSPTTLAYTVKVFDQAELRHQPKLTLTRGSATVGYQSVVHLTATLGATYANRSLTISAQVNGSGKAKVIASGQVNARGQLAVAYTARQSTTFRAAFAGDARDAAVKASAAVTVRAQVKETLTGKYGTKKSGGLTYLLYHRTGKVTVAAVVLPSRPGACVKTETQVYAKGAWNASARSGCAKLSPASKATVHLALGRAKLGVPYRVRADYVSSGPQNASGSSAWQYFIVKK